MQILNPVTNTEILAPELVGDQNEMMPSKPSYMHINKSKEKQQHTIGPGYLRKRVIKTLKKLLAKHA